MAATDQYETDSEESYFVSMTDIMVGMLFVFIILLMYFAYRIQDTERTVPLSEHQAALRHISEIEEELNKLRQNPLERYLQQADSAREKILYELQRSLSNVQGISES